MESGNELTAHMTTGAAIVYAIQWLKQAGWFTWINADTKTINRVVSAVLAAVAAVGINWTYQADVDNGTLILTGVSWTAILGAAWEWLKQFSLQQMIFDGVVSPKAVLKEDV